MQKSIFFTKIKYILFYKEDVNIVLTKNDKRRLLFLSYMSNVINVCIFLKSLYLYQKIFFSSCFCKKNHFELKKHILIKILSLILTNHATVLVKIMLKLYYYNFMIIFLNHNIYLVLVDLYYCIKNIKRRLFLKSHLYYFHIFYAKVIYYFTHIKDDSSLNNFFFIANYITRKRFQFYIFLFSKILTFKYFKSLYSFFFYKKNNSNKFFITDNLSLYLFLINRTINNIFILVQINFVKNNISLRKFVSNKLLFLLHNKKYIIRYTNIKFNNIDLFIYSNKIYFSSIYKNIYNSIFLYNISILYNKNFSIILHNYFKILMNNIINMIVVEQNIPKLLFIRWYINIKNTAMKFTLFIKQKTILLELTHTTPIYINNTKINLSTNIDNIHIARNKVYFKDYKFINVENRTNNLILQAILSVYSTIKKILIQANIVYIDRIIDFLNTKKKINNIFEDKFFLSALYLKMLIKSNFYSIVNNKPEHSAVR